MERWNNGKVGCWNIRERIFVNELFSCLIFEIAFNKLIFGK